MESEEDFLFIPPVTNRETVGELFTRLFMAGHYTGIHMGDVLQSKVSEEA